MARDTRGRDDGGRFADGIDPETVLDVFDAREDLARPITATDVVDELGIARRTAHNKLNALVERGVLETRKIGARGRVWWTPIDAHPTPDSRPETDADGDETHTSGAGPAADDAAQGDARLDETLSDRAADVVDEIDAAVGLEGDGLDWERRRDAVVHLYEHLRRHEGERFRKSQLEDVLDADGVPTGYAVFASLWKNWVTGSGDRPNLLASFPGVEQRGNGYVFERELVDA